jgi:2-methylcitrate dehydratase PrpD
MINSNLLKNSNSFLLLDYIYQLKTDQIPERIIEKSKDCLIDALGCTVFGSQQVWSKILQSEVLNDDSNARATIIGTSYKTSTTGAALCNGTAAHGFELDDLIDEPIVHPGAIIIPAALAAAEVSKASGARVLLGIITGYEIMGRIGLALGVSPAHLGFHKTTLAGPVGAAVAVSVIMNLSRDQLFSAVGLACSTSSGIKTFATGDGGGMMKRLHAGRAAESGVRMAQLAAKNFTAPPYALDSKFGLIEVFGGTTANAEYLSQSLGSEWMMDKIFVKVYSCCSWIQAAIQQIVTLRGPVPLKPSDVLKIRIGVCAYARINNGEPAPIDTMGAQYSFPYCAALALCADPANPSMYSDQALNDPDRRKLAQQVEMFVDPQMEAAYPKHYGSRVEIYLKNGKVLHSTLLDPHGMPADPFSRGERDHKFSRLTSGILPTPNNVQILQILQHCENLRNLDELMSLLQTN